MKIQFPSSKFHLLFDEKKRYKVFFGGRGCVDGNTKIKTPNGYVCIKDFKGGEIYSYTNEGLIKTFACKPIKYPKEPLYKVKTENNEIIITAKHRFLTQRGWVDCQNLNLDSDFLLSINGKVSCDFQQKHYEELPSKSLLNVQSSMRKVLNFLYCYLQDFHLYDEQLLSEVNTYRDILPSLDGVLQHKNHVLSRKGVQELSCIYDLSYQFLFHFYNYTSLLISEEKNSKDLENYNVYKSFVLTLEIYLKSLQSRECNNPLLLIHKFLKLLLSYDNLLSRDKNFQTIFHMLSFVFRDNSYSTSIKAELHTHDLHNNIKLEKIKSISFEKYDNFYDMFVPLYNNYIGNNIVNHNSGKSWSIATALILLSMKSKLRILCARQLQTSIADSVHKLLSDTISRYKMDAFFDITNKSIVCKTTGSEFIFKGIQNNINEIKSIEGINICWCEEAQSISQESWDILIPTIRQEGSEIWVSFNPDKELDPTYQMFVASNRPDCSSVLVNYYDNRFFPETLRAEMEYCKSVDYAKYENVWLGKCVINNDAQVYNGKFEMKEFETPKDARFFFGADWGFAKDPTAITRCFIQDQCLYIDYESGGVGVEFEELPALFDVIPEVRKWKILADCARPETISYVYNKGFNIEACPKWKGSIEDGVEYIRSFRRIYVHPRCPKTYKEFQFYSYKTDKLTNEILPIIVDKDNHYLDSLRYGLNSYIQKDVSFLSMV